MSFETRQAINSLMVGMTESQLNELLRVARELIENPGKVRIPQEDTLQK